MALEAVVYQRDVLSIYNGLLGTSSWGYDCGGLEKLEAEDKFSLDHFLDNQTESDFLHSYFNELYQPNSSSDATNNTINNPNHGSSSTLIQDRTAQMDSSAATSMPISRPKRRRSKSRKNKEEIENQRMTHIAVERNRRKQMNEYLSILRSLMPESYVQRADQASIVGAAINFVKELEHKLQLLGGQKELMKEKSESCSPFAEFFTFPQYSTGSSLCDGETTSGLQNQSAIGDIEVSMVESHANLRIRSKRRPKQLLKLVSGLHTMRLTILHLNITTVEHIVLYSLSVKVEDDCKLTSVDDIAKALHQLLGRIQEDAMFNSNM
ncbi:transcription factor bHLH94-like [Mangifera indica]|uniref:transcription factor bHLH94-like n=1 Tax=Mangifera indica TaxID=29780 RepID=UPI001CFA0CFC|nr:transcription factor bHLH94-like [Mangifera indica]